MNKSKIKHLPFNLFWELPSLIGALGILLLAIQLPTLIGSILSVIYYFTQVRISVEADYANERIEKLEQRGTLYKY